MADMLKYPGSLHNHSDYSNFRLRDSINKVSKLIDRAIELGHKVVAITEHETVASAVEVEEYYDKIKKDNPDFKVIRGNEIYLCRNGLNAANFNADFDKYYHFILLAKDEIGHRQIREISTRAWRRAYVYRRMMRVPTYYQDLFDIIGENPGHVIGTTACIGGALGTQLLKYKETQNPVLMDKIEFWCDSLQNLFGEGNFYFEMQPSNDTEQIYVNSKIIELSEKLNIPFIITNDAHYLKREDLKIQEAFLNAQGGDREVASFYKTTYLMSNSEIYSYMVNKIGEENLQKAFRNIEKISNLCTDYSIKKPLKIPNLKWKNFNHVVNLEKYIEKIPMFSTFLKSEYKADKELVFAIIDGIESHSDLRNDEAYREINSNLEMTWQSSQVNNACWSAYFLNLQKIIDVCWEAGSLVGPGRGSGVGFILLYVLGITQINPLREATQVFSWRFLNPERVSVLDVDFDIEGGRRADVLKAFRKEYGEDRVANVLTLGTEKSKSAILTAARGLGIDVDIAQYLSSMIEADRGQLRTLSQTFFGDEEKGYLPNQQFVYEMTENYPDLWEVAQSIEGLICRVGVHAGGVIFVDESFTNSAALMKAPSGEIITQFDLHDAEKLSLIKYDALSVEAMDKIHNALDLICNYGYAERKETLRETYESILGVYNLERDEPEMWNLVHEHKIQSLFQMEQQSGIQGIATLKPTSVDDLAILNSTIRLMAQEKGGEMPTDKLARFKRDPYQWTEEMDRWGLTEEEQDVLRPILNVSYGLCIAQEQFMQLVQLPELGGFNLTWADKLRKSIAKKNPAEYDKLTEEFYRITTEKGISQKFARYVWQVLIGMSRGYGFNQSHTLAYSLIALQEMNIAFKYPILFWNCACLISDSGGNEREEVEEETEDLWEEEYDNVIEDFSAEEDEAEEETEEEKSVSLSKKGSRSANYGKIAAAIGKMKSEGVYVAPPDINKSGYTFLPDVENNIILYGLSGIVKVGDDIVKNIIANRPYNSIEDFLNKVKVNKPQMINLIKCGAFDSFGDREKIMRDYAISISNPKKRITLQNMKMLIDFGLIPDKYDLQRRVYNFNKYLKKFKVDIYYYLDNIAYSFYSQYFDLDLLYPEENAESGLKIKQIAWDNIYQSHMDIVRPYVKKNNQELLQAVNDRLVEEAWEKYCQGSISKWEMDSVSFYSHTHELEGVGDYYGFADFAALPEEPRIDRIIPIKDKRIPLFKIERIIGTVLDKDKNKKTVTLLTTSGVVTVKIFGAVFVNYDKQISEKGADGHKHVIEKSWFSRGEKIIVTGIRRGDAFIAKKYSKTPYHLVEKITHINEDGTIETVGERAEV